MSRVPKVKYWKYGTAIVYIYRDKIIKIFYGFMNPGKLQKNERKLAELAKALINDNVQFNICSEEESKKIIKEYPEYFI